MELTKDGLILTLEELAMAKQKSVNSIRAWVRQGCPYEQKGARGKPWKFNSAAVDAWREGQKVAEATGAQNADEQELKRRKLAAETMSAELTLAKAREEVAPIEEFERAWGSAFATLRANILNVPGRTVGQIVGETNERVIKDKLHAELVQALQSAADADIDMSDETAEAWSPRP